MFTAKHAGFVEQKRDGLRGNYSVYNDVKRVRRSVGRVRSTYYTRERKKLPSQDTF